MHENPNRRAVATSLAGALALPVLGAPSKLATILAPATGPAMVSAGVIARSPNGRIALRLAGGVALDQGGLIPFRLDAPFRVASVSKMIASAGFVPALLASGQSLDNDASTLLGFRLRHPDHPDTAITLRMLLSHTSSLRNGPSYPVPFGHRLAEAFTPGARHFDAGRWFGSHPPGKWFAYADVNFALIGQILETLTGERFDHYMTRKLFRPLGLDIGFNWSGVSQAKRHRAAPGLRSVDGSWVAQVDAAPPLAPRILVSRAPDATELDLSTYRPGDNGFVFSPQGGLRLSLTDMDVLARMFAAGGVWQGKRVISRAALTAMETTAWVLNPGQTNGETDEGVFAGYGLGVQTPLGRPGPLGDAFFGKGSDRWRGHLGDAYGWMTGLFWNLDDQRTIVWAINGMPEEGRPMGLRSCLTAPEEALVELALARLV